MQAQTTIQWHMYSWYMVTNWFMVINIGIWWYTLGYGGKYWYYVVNSGK